MRICFNIIFILLILSPLIFPTKQLNNNSSSLVSVKEKITSNFFTRLYSNTYYSLLSRIEDDGYLQESMTGQYDGEYCRTVGAMVPLLIRN